MNSMNKMTFTTNIQLMTVNIEYNQLSDKLMIANENATINFFILKGEAR